MQSIKMPSESNQKVLNSGMNPKTVKIIYWSVTIFFSLFMLMDGVAGVMRVEGGQEALRTLGYPMYALTIFGSAKILGSLALLQTKFKTLKEWAYAGFTFNFLGAAASWAFLGNVGFIFPPLIALSIMSISYFFWKKYQQIRGIL